MTRINAWVLAGLALALLPGCQSSPPVAPPAAPAVRVVPLAPPAPPAAQAPAAPPAVASVAPSRTPPPAVTARPRIDAPALPAMDLPPGPIYVCEVAGARTPLELPEGVEALCRRHPEMGPCQYERDACRQRGGRVWTSKGEEVTPAVENAYDQRVHRVRLRADGGGSR